jgi:hypothetical protein
MNFFRLTACAYDRASAPPLKGRGAGAVIRRQLRDRVQAQSGEVRRGRSRLVIGISPNAFVPARHCLSSLSPSPSPTLTPAASVPALGDVLDVLTQLAERVDQLAGRVDALEDQAPRLERVNRKPTKGKPAILYFSTQPADGIRAPERALCVPCSRMVGGASLLLTRGSGLACLSARP